MTATQITATPTDLLELFLAGGNVPSVERFTTTEINPVAIAQIGNIDGKEICAYGVKTEITGLTGADLHPVTDYRWKWGLDLLPALQEANLILWRKSDEAYSWLGQEVTEADKRQVQRRLLTPKVGVSFYIFRVLEVVGVPYWTVCLQDEVCGRTHKALYYATEPWPAGNLKMDDWTTYVVPEVVEEYATTCPHCGGAIKRYWAVRVASDGGVFLKSFLSKAEAEQSRGGVLAAKQHYIDRLNDQHNQKSSRDLALQIHDKANATQNQRYWFFKDLFPELVKAFNAADGWVEYNDPCFIEHYDRLEKAVKALELAFDEEEIRRLEEIEVNGLVAKLGSVLAKHVPSCPFCEQDYERGDAWLTEALTFGEAGLICGCAALAEGSPLAEEVKKYDHGAVILPKIETSTRDSGSGGVELVRIEVGTRTLVRVVAIDTYVKPKVAVIVDRQALIASTDGARRKEVWPETKAQMAREQIAKLEREVSEGTVLKVPFEWNEQNGNWSQIWRGGGETILYVVHGERVRKDMAAGWWYCREFARPERLQKPGFAFVVVDTIIRVPSEQVPKR